MINKFIPLECTECKHDLKVTLSKNGKEKLMCVNKTCVGVALRKFQKGMLPFKISGLGQATLESLFNAGITNIYRLLTVTEQELIDSNEFKKGRALSKILSSIKSCKTIKLASIIESLQFDGVGSSISVEMEKYYSGIDYDFTGYDYSIRELIYDNDSELNHILTKMVDRVSSIDGVTIVYPKKEEIISDDDVKIMEMTGSPKKFGFKDKKEFAATMFEHKIIVGKLNKDCHYLVTDNLESKTTKMEKVDKLNAKFGTNIKIVTYFQLHNMYNGD